MSGFRFCWFFCRSRIVHTHLERAGMGKELCGEVMGVEAIPRSIFQIAGPVGVNQNEPFQRLFIPDLTNDSAFLGSCERLACCTVSDGGVTRNDTRRSLRGKNNPRIEVHHQKGTRCSKTRRLSGLPTIFELDSPATSRLTVRPQQIRYKTWRSVLLAGRCAPV